MLYKSLGMLFLIFICTPLHSSDVKARICNEYSGLKVPASFGAIFCGATGLIAGTFTFIALDHSGDIPANNALPLTLLCTLGALAIGTVSGTVVGALAGFAYSCRNTNVRKHNKDDAHDEANEV